MTTETVLPGQLPPATPPTQNPAKGDYLQATTEKPTALGPNPTLEEILANVRGTQVPPAEGPVTHVEEDEGDEGPETHEPPADVSTLKTGDKMLDVAVSTFISLTGASSKDIQRALNKAMEHGDVSLIDEEFIKERFGDKAEQALQLSQAVVEHTINQTQEVINSTYAMAGGREQWEAAVGVFKQHASKGLTAAVVNMLNSGDKNSTKEAAELILSYGRNSGITPTVNPRVRSNAAPADAQGLSAQQFQKAIHALNPSSRTYNEDYNRLIQMRALGRSLNK